MMINRKSSVRVERDSALKEGLGKRRAVSISKTKNKTANRKNRAEKGDRADSFGSIPHSKGVEEEELFLSPLAVNTEIIVKRAMIKKGAPTRIDNIIG